MIPVNTMVIIVKAGWHAQHLMGRVCTITGHEITFGVAQNITSLRYDGPPILIGTGTGFWKGEDDCFQIIKPPPQKVDRPTETPTETPKELEAV